METISLYCVKFVFIIAFVLNAFNTLAEEISKGSGFFEKSAVKTGTKQNKDHKKIVNCKRMVKRLVKGNKSSV